VDPVASTTKVEEDVDGRPPRGRYRWVRQHPPPMLKMTSMAGPWGVLSTAAASTTEVEEDIDGGPPGGHGDIAKEVIYYYKCSMLFILPRHWYLVETGIRI
jgi:hypothetical protein